MFQLRQPCSIRASRRSESHIISSHREAPSHHEQCPLAKRMMMQAGATPRTAVRWAVPHTAAYLLQRCHLKMTRADSSCSSTSSPPLQLICLRLLSSAPLSRSFLQLLYLQLIHLQPLSPVPSISPLKPFSPAALSSSLHLFAPARLPWSATA